MPPANEKVQLGAVPEQGPVQPVNTVPEGEAVSVTVEPAVPKAAQALPQLIRPPSPETIPLPVRVTVMESAITLAAVF